MQPIDAQLQAFLIEKFGKFLSEERRNSIEHVLTNRTKHIKVLLEDLIDSHNVSAILRTGECLGIQEYHIVDNDQRFKIGKGVSKGASKWIDIHRYNQPTINNSILAVEQLKQEGYQIMVTAPATKATALSNIDVSKPFVLVLGNETAGASETMLSLADTIVSIPMYGFTESYNVSVAAAISLSYLVGKIHQEVDNWQLKECELAHYKYQWYKKCMARPDYYHNYYVNAYELDQRI